VKRITTLLIATALALTSCGGDDDSDDATGQTEATEESRSTSSTAGDDVAESEDDPSTLAQAFLDGLGFDIPTTEAECAARGMVDAIGLGRLAELGESGAEPSPEDLGGIASALNACVSPETVEALLAEELATDVPPGEEAAANCLATEVSAETSMGDLARIGFLSESDPDSPELAAFEQIVTAAGQRCGIE
jgi:hypothetical protein